MLNSYSKCRSCAKALRTYVTGGGKTVKQIGNDKVCEGCDGFEAVTRKFNREEHAVFKRKMGSLYVPTYNRDCSEKLVGGWIVRVMDVRKSIMGTAWYQCNHASYKIGVRNFRTVTWFGSCSCNKLKVTPEIKKRLCPCCQHDLIWLDYFWFSIVE